MMNEQAKELIQLLRFIDSNTTDTSSRLDDILKELKAQTELLKKISRN